MPTTLESIFRSAVNEWSFWGKSTWHVASKKVKIGHIDNEPEYAQYVIDHYCSVCGDKPPLAKIINDKYYWSAVGMSAIMKNAGFSVNEFPFSNRHSDFIRRFIAARNKGDKRLSYWGYRLNESEIIPEPGDIVAYARGEGMTAEKAAKLFDATGNYESHSDVVVAKRLGEIDVIGCNVKDSVTKKTLSINEAGQITDKNHFWFVILKRREI